MRQFFFCVPDAGHSLLCRGRSNPRSTASYASADSEHTSAKVVGPIWSRRT